MRVWSVREDEDETCSVSLNDKGDEGTNVPLGLIIDWSPADSAPTE